MKKYYYLLAVGTFFCFAAMFTLNTSALEQDNNYPIRDEYEDVDGFKNDETSLNLSNENVSVSEDGISGDVLVEEDLQISSNADQVTIEESSDNNITSDTTDSSIENVDFDKEFEENQTNIEKSEQIEDNQEQEDLNQDESLNENQEIQNGWSEDRTQFYIDGELQYGLLEIEGYTYCFDENGNMVHGFYSVNENGVDHTYYFDEDGRLVRGLYTIQDSNQHSSYYFDENGYLYYGQLYLDKYWYYFRPESGLMATGITTILPEYNNGVSKTVYYDEYGHMFFGQIQIDGKWYYFQPDTGQMATNGVYTISAQYANGREQISVYDEMGVRMYGQVRSKDIVYYVDSNGYVTRVDLTGIGYLSQRDNRWIYTYIGDYNMGESGCYPTVMTMVINYFLNANLTPVEVGTLLHEYNLFNISGAGAGGDIVRFLANHYGCIIKII